MQFKSSITLTASRKYNTGTRMSDTECSIHNGLRVRVQVGDGRVEKLSMGPTFPRSQVTPLDWDTWKGSGEIIPECGINGKISLIIEKDGTGMI